MLTVRSRRSFLIPSMVFALSAFAGFFQVFPVFAHPPIVVPLKAGTEISFYDKSDVPNPLNTTPKRPNFLSDLLPAHPDKYLFQNLQVRKGQELKIDSLVLSQNTLAIYAGLTRGTDALGAGDIETNIDTENREKFLRLVLEMARLRRHAESLDEWNDITQKVRGRRADWNYYLFKTDYVVVVVSQNSQSSTSTSNSNDETKYYVPLDEVLAGAGQIDVHSTKLAILQSMSLKVLERLGDTEDFDGAEAVKTQLAQMSKSLEKICDLKDHVFAGETPVGCFITDLGNLDCAGKDKDLGDSDLALLKLRKQIALLQIVQAMFPSLKGLEGLDVLTQTPKFEVNCKDRDTLFQGLEELEEEGE